MRYSKVTDTPALSEITSRLLAAVFPDIEKMGYNATGHGYNQACERVAQELGLMDYVIAPDTELFRFMAEVNRAGKCILEKENECFDSNSPAYANFLNNAMPSYIGDEKNIRNWLEGKTASMRRAFDTTVIFLYMLFKRSVCADSISEFVDYCYKSVGIETDGYISYLLHNFDLKTYGEQDKLCGFEYTRLGSKGIIALGACVLCLFELAGKTDIESRIDSLQQYIGELVKDDVKAVEAFDSAEKNLISCIKYFEPRSIPLRPNQFYIQDFFVPPVFSRDGEAVSSPLQDMVGAVNSRRSLIVAKTGLGKSAYMQMVALATLQHKYDLGIDKAESVERLKTLGKELGASEDMYVISIPARMFSYCYGSTAHKEWTSDLLKLYFNCLWKLNDKNFFATQSGDISAGESEELSYELDDALLGYIKHLAKSGRLLVLLDSYDEIASGDMRNAYLCAVAKFSDTYCKYHNSAIGAHIIASSRQMSDQTMNDLCKALESEGNVSGYGIFELGSKQRQKLVEAWSSCDGGVSKSDTAALLDQIDNNHFYQDYSVNPYMLSVICYHFGKGLGDNTQRFISTLVAKMSNLNSSNRRFRDDIIQTVLMDVEKILQDIAGETVLNCDPHFSRVRLNKYIARFIDRTEITEQQFEDYINILHEFIVVAVGLIVPADGKDDAYQFINDPIRYELAAKGIQRHLNDEGEKSLMYREQILPSITSHEEYVGFFIPLLCSIKLENVHLAEQLVYDFVMRDFENEDEERILLRGMTDLLLGRYDDSIISVINPGRRFVGYVRRAQRILLIRLFSSKAFAPTEREKKEIRENKVYTANSHWLNDGLKKLVEE